MSELKQILCPHCLTPNRVPNQRLSEQPKCGRCHQLLFTGKPMELDEAAFRKLISKDETPIIVDFWASWCGPCQMMAPHFAASAKQLEPKFRLAKLNTEQSQALSTQFGIRSIPTLVAFYRGREINRISGALSQQQLMQWARDLPVH